MGMDSLKYINTHTHILEHVAQSMRVGVDPGGTGRASAQGKILKNPLVLVKKKLV